MLNPTQIPEHPRLTAPLRRFISFFHRSRCCLRKEWNATQPFPFFCDLTTVAIRQMRCARDVSSRQTIPGPLSLNTFEPAVLRWEYCAKQDHREWLSWYRHILAVRRAAILPLLKCLPGAGLLSRSGPQPVTVQWLSVQGVLLRLDANLSNSVCDGFAVAEGREVRMEGHRDERGALQPGACSGR
jgi:1,4-alpha-glucan branching enzyme